MDRNAEPTADRAADGHDILGDEFSQGESVSEETAVKTGKPEQGDRRARLRRLRKPLLFAAPAIAVAGALFLFATGGRYEKTDNAYLQSGLVQISPKIQGEVIEVAVRNNQFVHKGDVLFRLDPAAFQTAEAEAEAQVAAAKADVRRLRANYAQGQSQLATVHQQVLFADREAERQRKLVAEGISSQAQYDAALLAARTARQGIQTASQENAAVAASLAGAARGPVEAQPAVRSADAVLQRAKLNLSYTTVRAPQDGIVAKVDQMQVGNTVAAGRPVFSLSTPHLWVEANFKENQLRYMRAGQPATIKVDAFPDVKLKAHVASFSPATGNRFSVLPAENATGNWVKVVQRLPVEFTLDEIPQDLPLQAGLSATVSVDTGHQRLGGNAKPAQVAASGAQK